MLGIKIRSRGDIELISYMLRMMNEDFVSLILDS